MKNTVLAPAALAGLGWITGALWAARERRRRLFSPDVWPAGDWSVLPKDERQEFIVPTRDGETLHAWHLASEGEFDPIMIWFHGAGGNLTGRVPIADRLRRKGVSVFRVDWRGYGHSTGSPTEAGLLVDAVAVRDFVSRHFPSSRPVVLFGESLGGPYAAWVAARRGATAVIVENTFPSLAALANHEYAPFPAGIFASRSLRTADWLNDAGAPVLVIHGKKDQTVPFQLGVRLYNSLETPRALLISDDAGHNEVGIVDADRFDAAILDFISCTTTGYPDLFGE